jgi:Nucleotidyl transferase AbiEii toxin, Type IV TA system
MPQRLEPKLDVLPAAQKEIWTSLAPASHLGFVLYGGTAIALQLGHRESLDFDFFRSEAIDKDRIRATFQFVRGSAILQDTPETLDRIGKLPEVSLKAGSLAGH